MLRLPSLIAGACAGLLAAPLLQDPPPAPKPADPPPASAPVAPAAPANHPQAVPGQRVPHRLEGVYELRRRMQEGKHDALPSRGYLTITARHLFLCVGATGPDPALPLLRASARTWRPEDERVRMVVQLGWFTDVKGVVHVEKPGTEELRRIELVRGGVRVVMDERNWLEFERVE